jgi:transposase
MLLEARADTFGLVECHSRKLYLESTHSQSFETFVRCHIHAFRFMGGIARKLWFDNLATAVVEHDGRETKKQRSKETGSNEVEERRCASLLFHRA